MSAPTEPRGATDAVSVSLSLPPEVIDLIVERAVSVLADRVRQEEPEPWIGVEEAAAHLACSRKRVYDLVAQRRIRVRRDGRRLLFRRSWLDAALDEGQPPANEAGRP